MLKILSALLVVCVLILWAIPLVPVSSPGQFSSVPMKRSVHLRTGDQTYLTYPEWFLVFSSKNIADFTKTGYPDEFPFMSDARSFWSGVETINDSIKDYPENKEYQSMIKVIGVSTTLEYGIKTVYENTVGRASRLFSAQFTEMDHFYSSSMSEYVDFINYEPWYKFDFLARIPQIISIERMPKDSILRHYERKFALIGEFFFKAVYSRIIGKLATSSYEAPIMYTLVESRIPLDIQRINASLKDKVHQVSLIGEDSKNKEETDSYAFSYLVPRYYPFTLFVQEMAKQQPDYRISKIAGNQGFILMSIIAPDSFVMTAKNIKVLQSDILAGAMEDPLPSYSGRKKRMLIEIPVHELISYSASLGNSGVFIEHVFDF